MSASSNSPTTVPARRGSPQQPTGPANRVFGLRQGTLRLAAVGGVRCRKGRMTLSGERVDDRSWGYHSEPLRSRRCRRGRSCAVAGSARRHQRDDQEERDGAPWHGTTRRRAGRRSGVRRRLGQTRTRAAVDRCTARSRLPGLRRRRPPGGELVEGDGTAARHPGRGKRAGPRVPGGHRATWRPQRSPDDAGHRAADRARDGATGRAHDGGARRDPETTAHDAEDHAFRQAAARRVADGDGIPQDPGVGGDRAAQRVQRMTVVWREHS